MDRRTFAYAGAIVLLGVPLRADAQRAGAMPRIGLLTPVAKVSEPAFLQGMRDVCFVEKIFAAVGQ